MGAIVVVLLLALVLAAAVIVYAAYPYRGEETPVIPLLGQAMRRGVRLAADARRRAARAPSSTTRETHAAERFPPRFDWIAA